MPSTTDNETMIEEASAGQEKDEPKQKHEPVQQGIQASFHLQQQHAQNRQWWRGPGKKKSRSCQSLSLMKVKCRAALCSFMVKNLPPYCKHQITIFLMRIKGQALPRPRRKRSVLI